MATQRGWRVAVVTISDGVVQGFREDTSGEAVSTALGEAGFEVVAREAVPDERQEIEAILIRLSSEEIPLIVTTGGTGLGPRDVTPEATQAVIEREVQGLAEAMRAAGRASTPFAALSRGMAGTREASLIVNLPGSRTGALESLMSVLQSLPHALALLAGQTVHGPHEPHSEHGQGPDRVGGSLDHELAARRDAGEEVVVATAVKVEGNPPCRVGQKMLLGKSGPLAGTLGCAEFDDAAVADAPVVLDARAPATRTYAHELGSVEVFLEPILRRPLLVAFSATPVARALLGWAGELGFDPVLVEPRTERVTPDHRRVARVVAGLDEVAVDADTVAVHTDHDAPGVAESVAALLESPARFIGVMGSARHVGPHVENLRKKGFTDADLARVRTPVGIDLGARTAEEIALSILAGVVADRQGAAGGWLDRR